MRVPIIILSVLSFLFLSCERAPTNGEDHGSRQEHIPWPSLASSPWPMFHHDPQSTGRSQYVGPQSGRLKWEFSLSPGITQGSVGIGSDSTIYFASSRDHSENDTTYANPETYLYAVDFGGNLKWRFRIHNPPSNQRMVPELFDGPLITADGTVVISSSDNSIYAINPDGTLRWVFDTQVFQDSWFTGPIIDLSDVIYTTVGSHTLFALSKSGAERWSTEFERSITSINISPEGQFLYVVSYRLDATDLSGSPLWQSRAARNVSIDNDGNIYTLVKKDSLVYCIRPSGDIKWSYDYSSDGGRWYDTSIANTIDVEGNFYFTGRSENGELELVSIDHDGELRWKYQFDDHGGVGTHLICDSEGTVYLGRINSRPGDAYLYAVSNTGELKWKLGRDIYAFHGSPAIGSDGTMYVCTYRGDGIVYAIE